MTPRGWPPCLSQNTPCAHHGFPRRHLHWPSCRHEIPLLVRRPTRHRGAARSQRLQAERRPSMPAGPGGEGCGIAVQNAVSLGGQSAFPTACDAARWWATTPARGQRADRALGRRRAATAGETGAGSGRAPRPPGASWRGRSWASCSRCSREACAWPRAAATARTGLPPAPTPHPTPPRPIRVGAD